MRVAVVSIVGVLTFLAAACDGSGVTRSSQLQHNQSSTQPKQALPLCPGGEGDAARTSPTFISPTDPKLRGETTVLARTTPTGPTVVHAVVTSSPPGAPTLIKALVRSQIVVVRRAFETIGAARRVPPPISPDRLLKPWNVIASSPVIRTTDTNTHPLTLRVPAGLSSRDYAVVGIQVFTELCRPRQTGTTETVIGLLRVHQPT